MIYKVDLAKVANKWKKALNNTGKFTQFGALYNGEDFCWYVVGYIHLIDLINWNVEFFAYK